MLAKKYTFKCPFFSEKFIFKNLSVILVNSQVYLHTLNQYITYYFLGKFWMVDGSDAKFFL